MTISMEPVGHVRASRTQAEDDFWGGTQAAIVLTPTFPEDALAGLDSFSHVEVVYHFHLAEESKVVSGARHPRGNTDWPKVGIFAQRAKNRPNRIGCTLCSVLKVEGRTLIVAELDAIDGTPVLDIKPVMQEFLPRSPVQQPEWCTELMREYWLRGE